ncbi:hypothetical protein [Arthrobacter sp. SD76]|uniref:hypothetical protein n=1 Tax=Arthrobacter sp. SD76 TaxID=3415007 RepID=UPI003C75707E
MLASISRRAILGIYAIIIIVPLTVVGFGSFKSTQELFAGPFSLPQSLSPPTTQRSSAARTSARRSGTASSSPPSPCRSPCSWPAWPATPWPA